MTHSFLRLAAALAALALAAPAWAEARSARIGVDGMVCAFCAQGIEKKLKARAEIERIFVSLENRIVAVGFRDGRTLSDDELALYRQIFDSLKPQAPTPDLVIYLQAQPDTLVERVRKRGVPIEASMSEEYLRALGDAYSRFFHHFDAAPLLIVNTEHLNPVDRDADLDLLLQHVASMRGRREFFNLAR